jgi:biopolymer transport protein ExbD
MQMLQLDDNVGSLEEESEEPPRLLSRKLIEADMDITPMIDMTFLLLIFFLVSSTPDKSTVIDLPKASHGVGVSQLNSVIFTIGMGGLGPAPVYAADGRIPGAELSDNLETRGRQIAEAVEKGFRENKPNVVIKADRDVAYREVARVVKAVSQIEGVKIHLAVLETQ